MIVGKAKLLYEADGQYTLLLYKQSPSADGSMGREKLQSTTPNLTLAAAFDQAKTELAAYAVNPEKHLEVTIITRIADPSL